MVLLAFTAGPVLAQVRIAPSSGAPAPAGSVGRPSAPPPPRTPSVLTPGSSSPVPTAGPSSVDDIRAVDPRVAPTVARPTDPCMGPAAPPTDPRGGARSMAPISADPHAGLPCGMLINPATGTILDPTLTTASPTVR
jgi:hypothetical protein